MVVKDNEEIVPPLLVQDQLQWLLQWLPQPSLPASSTVERAQVSGGRGKHMSVSFCFAFTLSSRSE